MQPDEQYPPGQGKQTPAPFGSQVLLFVQLEPVGLSASVQLPLEQTAFEGQLKHWFPKMPHAVCWLPGRQTPFWQQPVHVAGEQEDPASKTKAQVPLEHTEPPGHTVHWLPKTPHADDMNPGWHTPF